MQEFSREFHDAEAKEILDLIKACIQGFELIDVALMYDCYPKPEISKFIKFTDSLHIPTGPEPRISIPMVTETLNQFKQWTEVLGDMFTPCFRDCCFLQECEDNIENYKIDTKALTGKLWKLLHELRLVEEFAKSERKNRVQMANPLSSKSMDRHKGKQADIHEVFLNVQDMVRSLRQWGSRLEDEKQRRAEAFHRKNWEKPGIPYKDSTAQREKN